MPQPDRDIAARSKDANRISMSFSRRDFCLILDAFEAIIEDFKYDGGLVLAEDYIRLENRLRERLRSHDSTPFRMVARGR